MLTKYSDTGVMLMIFLFLAYLLNVADFLYTKYWITLYGIGIEINPIGRWMFETGVAGYVKILVIGGLFLLLGYMIKRQPKAKNVSYLLFGVYSLVVTYHTVLLFFQ